MVNQSELAFRLLCRRYGTQLAVTPMFHSENFGKDPTYRADAIQTPKEPSADRPLVAQFCGNNPATVLKAARFVEGWADAVDLNLGCPQGIAKRGHYGSFLLEESQLLHDIVATLHQYLSIPVTCKIRIVLHPITGQPDYESTIALVRMLQEAGAALITIHGRSRFQLKDAVGACDFDLIRLVKQNASVPVFANGGIYDMRDVQRCMAITGADGVMSSESLLCNPTLFSGQRVDSIRIAKEYMHIVHELEASNIQTEQSMVRAHLFKMLYQQSVTHAHTRSTQLSATHSPRQPRGAKCNCVRRSLSHTLRRMLLRLCRVFCFFCLTAVSASTTTCAIVWLTATHPTSTHSSRTWRRASRRCPRRRSKRSWTQCRCGT